MSKTPTFGTPGNIFRQALTPPRFGGMCSGPNFTSFSHFARLFASITAESLNTSAPWRMRWPIASISLSEATTPFSGSDIAATTAFSAAAWSGASTDLGIFSPPAFWYTSRLPGMPMRSTIPLQSIFSPFMSKSMYFSEDDPAFTTRTFLVSFFIIPAFSIPLKPFVTRQRRARRTQTTHRPRRRPPSARQRGRTSRRPTTCRR